VIKNAELSLSQGESFKSKLHQINHNSATHLEVDTAPEAHLVPGKGRALKRQEVRDSVNSKFKITDQNLKPYHDMIKKEPEATDPLAAKTDDLMKQIMQTREGYQKEQQIFQMLQQFEENEANALPGQSQGSAEELSQIQLETSRDGQEVREEGFEERMQATMRFFN